MSVDIFSFEVFHFGASQYSIVRRVKCLTGNNNMLVLQTKTSENHLETLKGHHVGVEQEAFNQDIFYT